jgi:hypothetical protein
MNRIRNRAKGETAVKLFALLLWPVLSAIPTLAQDKPSCKAFFQWLRADAATPGLRTGLDRAQKKWWQSRGQKKYPGLCLDGSVTSGDKPRYLVIWSKSKSIGQASPPANEVYGQTASALQATAPTARIYQPRWDLASVIIVKVQYDGSLMLPPVYFEADDRLIGALTGAGPINSLQAGSTKVLDAALRYLWQERVFLSDPN